MSLRVAVLGTGIMGAGMAANLVRSGADTTVWNRTRAKAAAIDGARVADSPADAVTGADAVITMLFDADSVAVPMVEALPAMRAGAVWAQMATVGIEGTGRLVELAEQHGVGFVDAPVLGTRQPAEQGALVILASGDRALEPAVAPAFDAVGSKTRWVSEQAGASSRLKLAVNAWVQTITVATAQSVALARALGVDPQEFLDTIEGSATDCRYAHLKGGAMIAGEFPAAFGLDGAVKDSGLIVDAMRGAGIPSVLMDAVLDRFRQAADAGHQAEDMAAVIHAF